MNEMIERVRAVIDGEFRKYKPGDLFDSHIERASRAAIGAMRDPPRDAILAGYKALMDWDARTGEDHGIFEVWRAMIDAILSPDSTRGE